jgi:hypothetical protein
MTKKYKDDFSDFPPSMAGMKKLKDVQDGFSFYCFEWLGDKPSEWTTMKLTGAVFREAKTGPRKGQRVVMVPGTTRTAYVTVDEINATRTP